MGRPKGSTNVAWTTIVAHLQRHPDRWVVLPEMAAVPARTIAVIRRRERRALRIDGGVVRCRVKARAWTDDGREIVSLSLKFERKKAPDGA